MNNMPSQTDLQSQHRTRALLVAGILLFTLIVFDIFSTINYFQNLSTPLLFAMILSYAATLASGAALGLILKRSVSAGVWILIITNLVALFLSPFLGAGLGVIYGITAVVVTVVISGQGLEIKQQTRANIIGVVVAVLIMVIDFLLPSDGVTNANNSFTFIILVGLLAVLAFFVFRQFTGYNLRNKLAVSFGAIFILGLVIAVAGLRGLNLVQTAYQNTLAGGVAIQNTSDHLNTELLEARRREKDFLLRWRDEGFETAYQNYVLLNQQHTAEMKHALDELGTLAEALERTPLPDYSRAQYEADIAITTEDLVIYEDAFADTISLIRERGFVDTGLEGEFRTAVQAIEAKIYDREGLEPLVITMLQIRRREKDYLLRGDQQYVDNVHELVQTLKEQVSASDLLSSAEKVETAALADQYLTKFDGLVDKDKDVADSIEVFRVAAAEIQTSVARLESAGEQLALLDVQTAQQNSTQTFTLTIVIVLFALVIAIVLALFLTRQITQPVLQLTATAQTIAAGRFDVQAAVTSTDEIGTLAQTFNTMTERLGEAFADVRRRAAELATVADVSTATSTILETDRLLQEVVDLTQERFNLYHSHIYLMDEVGENLVLAKGAGEPGRIMAAEKRSIPLSREQSLVARAARERQGVSVNDVTQAPDFLPNPLLPNTRSELAVPMIVGGNVIGVFDIQSDQVGRFTESDVAIQTTLAAQLATSIQNVRSFEQSKKQAELQLLVNVIGQRIQRTATIEEALQTAIRELGTAAGASRVKAKISRSNGDN